MMKRGHEGGLCWGNELSAQLVPDSALCRQAAEHAWELSEPFLYNHALRSYLFAASIARARAAAVDRELLYVACVLHDLGLTESAPVQARFEVEGADMACDWALRHDLTETKRGLLWDAIALHTTLEIPQRKAPEVALCQLGTAVDIGFAPIGLVEESVLREALQHFPRAQMKQRMPQTLCGIHRRNPQAAAGSPVTRAAAERLGEPVAPVPHLCDVIEGAAFDE